ncbi:hypothetical protein RIR_jg21168.t1 [Rhizophagus irregularis DAOM 181602=DAOM 197198]|nr:hypothetical protein RIR_jg21168.t1 [Rhizophagus irregularis DAOM 181602=DAOM 197198]
MSSIVVLLPEELSTRFNGCPLKMIGHRPEISLIRGNGWSGRKHLQRKRIKLEGLVTLSRWLVTETLIKPEYGEVAGSIPKTTEIKRILLRTLQPIA